MSARDEGHQHGETIRAKYTGLQDHHPISASYRGTLAVAAFEGGIRAGELGYLFETPDGAAFIEGFMAGLNGRP